MSPSVKIKIEDYDISGVMVGAIMTVASTNQMFLMDSEMIEKQVKRDLAQKIVEHLIENKLIEFTRSMDINNDAMIFKARVYVTPDAQVRTLRLSKS